MSLYKIVRISAIREETPDCKTFVLDTPDPELLRYRAGQFLTLVFAGISGEERRSYSISSSPALGEPLAITVKRVENGAWSRHLVDRARVGDALTVIGPTGFFTLPEDGAGYKRLFFIAAGSGITPVFSLIKTVLHAHPGWDVVLVYSNRSGETSIFYKELLLLAGQYHDRFKIEWLFSASKHLERARLSKWLLEILLKEHAVRVPLHQTLFYLCGPFDFMRMATIKLTEEGVGPQQVRKENFSTLKPVVKALPPDSDKHTVQLIREGTVHTLEVQYPQTILQAAKKAGIALAYSCEAGRCGSCAATCTHGKVWMSYNEVLVEEEMARGRVLTCVGYPVGGDVTIEYP